MKNNIFTVHLHDIILPTDKDDDQKDLDYMFLVMDYEQSDIKKLFTGQDS